MPSAFPGIAIYIDIQSFPMLFPIMPLANIGSTIWPFELALSLLLIIFILSLSYSFILYNNYRIFAFIWPLENTFIIHFVIKPSASISSTITPLVFALSLNVIRNEVTYILTAIWPHKDSLSMFPTFLIVSLIHTAIRPTLFSITMLFVILPVSFINSPICVNVPAMSMSLSLPI